MRPEAGTFFPDEAELLSRLWLNATDAARVCGVTVRQLTYWTDRGIVETHDGENRTYDLAALRRVVAIKSIMLKGYTLEKAAQLAAHESVEDQKADSSLSLSYLDDLAASVQAFVPKMHAYLALGRLQRLAADLASTDLERCFAESTSAGEVSQRVAGILDQASVAVDRAGSELGKPAIAETLVEVAEPSRALPA